MRTALCLCLAFCATTLAGLAQAEPSAYYGFTLLDPVKERRTENAYVIVDGRKLLRVGRGEPPVSIPKERRHDFSGHFMLPGLIDTHAHMTIGPLQGAVIDGQPAIETLPDDSITRHAALMLLAHGITTIRDPGGETTRALAYRRDAASGAIIGPEAKVAGLILERSPIPFRNLVTQVTDTSSVAPIVQQQAAAGVDYVKLYQGLTEQDLEAGIQAAHAAHIQAIAHLGDVSWTSAARLGIDALVHAIPQSPQLLPTDKRQIYLAQRRSGPFAFFEWYEYADLDAPPIRELIDTLVREKVWLDATLIAFHLAFRGDDLAYRDRDAAFAHPAMLENWRKGFRFDLGWKPEDYRRAQAVWPKVLQFTRLLHEAGVPMTIGTDMNNPFVAPGASVAREMQLHADAGIDNWAILRMATSTAAGLLRVGDRTGRIQAGLEADLVILKSDPSRDISAISRVAAVVNNGELYRPADLIEQARR